MIIAPHRNESSAVTVSKPNVSPYLKSDPTQIYAMPVAPPSAELNKDGYHTDPSKVADYEPQTDGSKTFNEAISDLYASLQEGMDNINIKPSTNPSTGPSYSGSTRSDNSGRTIDYLNADLAKHYGMDANAAYSEALQNTSYQRAVADLKAAGLNPVLAVNGMSGAGSFAAGDTLRSGSGSGSSGGSSYGKSGKYALSANSYNKVGVISQIAGAIAGAYLAPSGYKVLGASTGMAVAKQLGQSFVQLFTKAE